MHDSGSQRQDGRRRRRGTRVPETGRDGRAFTLVELLVVVGIIAMLVAILMPSLGRAKDYAQAARCATNTNSLGKQLLLWTTARHEYPPSYVYPYNDEGAFDLDNQPKNHPFGYLHWSHFLLGKENPLPDTAFRCPSMQHGGIPRTNPGPMKRNWEVGQADQNGDSSPNSLEDRQATRMAYTANAALIPRNKFTTGLSGGQRVNQLVRPEEVQFAGKTILVTEFFDNWRAVTAKADSKLVKSHRPVNPFVHVGAGTDEYTASLNAPGFLYGEPGGNSNDYGLKPLKTVMGATGLIDGSLVTELNAIGRHHIGGDEEFGGTANFLYCDGHVDRKTVLETMENREWGDAYYSINGKNEVLNY